MEKLFTAFRKSNLLLSLAAALLVWQTIIACGLSEQHLLFLTSFIFFATQFAYTATGIKFRFVKESEEKKLSLQISSPTLFHSVSSFVSGMACLIMFFHLSPFTQSFCIVVAVASFFYSLPVSFNARLIKGIRTIFILKNVWLVLVWSVATVLLPVLEEPTVHKVTVLFLLLKRFLFIYAITLPFDIRDLEGDRLQNVTTLPGRFGITATKMIAVITLGVFCLVVGIEHRYFSYGSEIILQLQWPLLLSAFIALPLIIFSTPSRKKFYYSLLLDGTMIVQFLLIYFFVKR